jgi:hypothetical protein
MSLLDKASLIVTPNAEKVGKVYSVIPSDGSGDLTVVRGTVATRVNSLGLVENVAVNEPRLNYDTVGGCPAILIEPQRTNLALRSEEFMNVIWTKEGSTLTANTTVAPDGLITADTLTENSAASTQHRLLQSITIVNTTNYTCSVYIKRLSGTRDFAIINTMSGQRVYYNMTTNTVANQVLGTGTITNMGNGWYRITASGLSTGTSANLYFAITNGTTTGSETYSGNGTSSFAIWGAQLELGAYPTSYIPTLGSAITRNLDNISKTAVSALIGQTEGTIFAEVRISRLIGTVSRYIFHISDGTANNRIYIAFSGASSNIIRARIFNAGNLETTIETSTITTTGRYKLALAYKNNDVVFYVNGVQIGTDVTASIPACSRVDLGQNYIAASQFSDSIINPNIFKTRLTNTELQNLTTL